MRKLGDLQFARAEGCGSLETFSLPGQRGVEAWRPSVCQGRGVWKLGDLQYARVEGLEAWRLSVCQGRGVQKLGVLQYARVEGCGSY